MRYTSRNTESTSPYTRYTQTPTLSPYHTHHPPVPPHLTRNANKPASNRSVRKTVLSDPVSEPQRTRHTTRFPVQIIQPQIPHAPTPHPISHRPHHHLSPPPLPSHEPRNARRASKFNASTSPTQKGRPRRAVKMKRLHFAPLIYLHTHETRVHVSMCKFTLFLTTHAHNLNLCPTPPDSLRYAILASMLGVIRI
ncbi:hypothetical protein BGY98DRAFT_1021389 [Russula aff. rugulosa BPL654]|nr:hypothetical protein BGY98DRAFT_1021389 [Russula aff. rugulosa BPL654]